MTEGRRGWDLKHRQDRKRKKGPVSVFTGEKEERMDARAGSFVILVAGS